MHSFPSLAQAILLLACVQTPPLHTSVVQGLLSLHTWPTPWQLAPTQTSLVVHGLPSSQAIALAAGVCTQPLDALQLSVVQALLSSQLTVAPTQALFTQVSPVVQASPSSHATPSAAAE